MSPGDLLHNRLLGGRGPQDIEVSDQTQDPPLALAALVVSTTTFRWLVADEGVQINSNDNDSAKTALMVEQPTRKDRISPPYDLKKSIADPEVPLSSWVLFKLSICRKQLKFPLGREGPESRPWSRRVVRFT
jgi:hypothetical protein